MWWRRRKPRREGSPRRTLLPLPPAVLAPSRGGWVRWAERVWGTCLAGGVLVCLSFLVSGRRRRNAPAAVYGAKCAWHRGCPPARATTVIPLRPREQPRGTEGAFARKERREKFAPSPNFEIQRRPARAPSRRGPNPGTHARLAPPQAPGRQTSKVAPSGLGLLTSLPERRSRREGTQKKEISPPPSPPSI